MSYVGKVKSDGLDQPVGSTLYGECPTPASEAAKAVSLGDFDTLMPGITIQIKFTNSNTAANPTMNINGTGAKPIYTDGTNAPGNTKITSWYPNSVVSLTYDGTAWLMNDVDINAGSGLQDLLDLIYPVGSIFMSVIFRTDAEINNRFGGTWVKIEDRFLIAASENYPLGSIDGAASVTLTEANLPSHVHAVGAHTHGLSSIKAWINSHVHGYSAAGSTTGGTAITVDQMPAHNHGNKSLTGTAKFRTHENSDRNLIIDVSANGICSKSSELWPEAHEACAKTESFTPYYLNNLNIDASHTHDSNGGGQAHSHTIPAASGTTAAAATAWSGDSTDTCDTFNTGSVGSSTAVNIMPPYLAVYVWKRIA